MNEGKLPSLIATSQMKITKTTERLISQTVRLITLHRLVVGVLGVLVRSIKSNAPKRLSFGAEIGVNHP